MLAECIICREHHTDKHVTDQLSSLAFQAMVTQINVLEEGLKQIETWEKQKRYYHWEAGAQ